MIKAAVIALKAFVLALAFVPAAQAQTATDGSSQSVLSQYPYRPIIPESRVGRPLVREQQFGQALIQPQQAGSGQAARQRQTLGQYQTGQSFYIGTSAQASTSDSTSEGLFLDCQVVRDHCEDPSVFDKDYLAGFVTVPWEMAKRPFDFSQEALIMNAIVLGGFGLTHLVDEDVREEAISEDNDDLRDVTDIFEPFGDFYLMLGATGGAYLAGELTGIDSVTRVGQNGFQALALAAIPVTLTKELVNRERPNKNGDASSWFDSGNSFLSGHTTYSFALASVIAREYEETGWVPYLAYGSAAMVGAQRITHDKHWISDVFVSALVGWGVGQMIYQQDYFLPDDGPVQLDSMNREGTQGLSLNVKF